MILLYLKRHYFNKCIYFVNFSRKTAITKSFCYINVYIKNCKKNNVPPLYFNISRKLKLEYFACYGKDFLSLFCVLCINYVYVLTNAWAENKHPALSYKNLLASKIYNCSDSYKHLQYFVWNGKTTISKEVQLPRSYHYRL